MSGPNLELSKLMLLQHFHRGLSKESAQFLDIFSGDSFTLLTSSDGRNIHNKIVENTPYTSIFDEFTEEEVDEILEPENEVLPIQPTPMAVPFFEPIKVEPPVENLHSLEDEENHLMDFISEIEDDLFSNFGNASKFSIQPKPRACNSPFQQHASQPDKPILKEDLKCLSAAISVEWSREAETSLEVVRLIMPSTLLSYQIQGVMMDVQYNPTVGINIISKSLAQQLYPNMTLCLSQKIFQEPYGTMLECL
jgi:hypothetical protein